MTAAAPEQLTVEELFERNRAWAAVIARNVKRKLPASFDAGDLEIVALAEMREQALTYDPANVRGKPFQAYAYLAVRGACLMAVQHRNGRKRSRQRAELLKEIDVLAPVDAYLIRRTFIDEADLDALAKLAGVERGALLRRVGGIVKRLKKAKVPRPRHGY